VLRELLPGHLLFSGRFLLGGRLAIGGGLLLVALREVLDLEDRILVELRLNQIAQLDRGQTEHAQALKHLRREYLSLS